MKFEQLTQRSAVCVRPCDAHQDTPHQNKLKPPEEPPNLKNHLIVGRAANLVCELMVNMNGET